MASEVAAGENASGVVFTNGLEWVASLTLLVKQGHLANVQIGYDEDSQQFAAEVLEQNPDWEPGQVPVVPPPAEVFQLPNMSSPQPRDPILFVPARFLGGERPREHRSPSRTRQASRDGPDGDEPEPGSAGLHDLRVIPISAFLRQVDAALGSRA